MGPIGPIGIPNIDSSLVMSLYFIRVLSSSFLMDLSRTLPGVGKWVRFENARPKFLGSVGSKTRSPKPPIYGWFTTTMRLKRAVDKWKKVFKLQGSPKVPQNLTNFSLQMAESTWLQLQGALPLDPGTRGSAPGPRCGLCPQTALIGSRLSIIHCTVEYRSTWDSAYLLA